MNARLFLSAAIVTLAPGFASAQSKAPADPLDGPPIVSAKAWAIADGGTGKILWGSHETEPRPIASTTKIMTAFLVLKLAETDPKVLDEVMTFSERAAKTPGSSSKLQAGDRISVRDLLYGLMLPSGNDAAVAVAEQFGPRFPTDSKTGNDPVARFVAEMNRRAQALDLKDTNYLDPNGLSRNQASPRDLSVLTAKAMQLLRFREYVDTREHECSVLAADGKKRPMTWKNTNQLLGIEGFDGVKTGTTTPAGGCLVASGHRGSDHLIVVILGSVSTGDARYTDARNLFRWAWVQRQK
jgi:D-alanyl-D-alanine carboxypeptidase (penicillin-binding protein 5/6)